MNLDIDIDMKGVGPILWESFYVVNASIKRSNLVLYFQSGASVSGDVKVQESEVMFHRWKPTTTE